MLMHGLTIASMGKYVQTNRRMVCNMFAGYVGQTAVSRSGYFIGCDSDITMQKKRFYCTQMA